MKDSMAMIDWLTITSKLTDGVEITADKTKWNLNTPGYLEIYKMWEDGNFNMSAVKWINYYPEKHYDKEVESTVALELGIVPLRSWISRIDPGYCAPWHWDVDDNEQEYLTNGKLHRYSIFIEHPKPGHIFIIDDKAFVFQPYGTIIKWDNYRAWHAGSNVGVEPKFMFHIIGHTC